MSRKKSFLIASLLCLLFVFGMNTKGNAQSLNFREIDEISYRLFLARQWDSLIAFNQEAIQHGHESYYLYLRSGIAWYEKGNFRNATSALEKAMVLNSWDPLCRQYLYWSYVFSGRPGEAKFQARSATPDFRKKAMIPDPHFLESVSFEAGPSFSDNLKKVSKGPLIGPAGVYGERNLYDQGFYTHFGIKHHVAKRISFYQGFSHVGIDMRKDMQFNTFDSLNTFADTSGSYRILQNSYYLRADIRAGKSWTITPAFHFISAKSESYGLEYQSDTSWYWDNPDEDTVQLMKYVYTYTMPVVRQSFSNFVLSLALSKDIGLISIQAHASISNLNDLKQSVVGAAVAYFPSGNLNLYGSTALSWFTTETKIAEQYSTPPLDKIDQHLIFKQMIGFKLLSKLWVEANFSWGELTNYNDNNGFLAYNIPDRISTRLELALLMPFSKHLDASLRYMLNNKTTQTLRYTDLTNYIIKDKKYINHNIIGGIQWKF